MDDSKVFMFPNGGNSSIDPNLMLALNNGGGFGGGNWIWILFLWFIYGRNGWGNDLNNVNGTDLIMQGINGRADALGQLSQITHTSVEAVRSVLSTIQASIQEVTAQTGMSALQIQNAIQSGNAALSQQLCQCCCENRLAIANQTNALQTQMAANHAAATLQAAQAEAADQLAVCQQTNQLGSQADRNTNSILNAIAGQNTLITKEFCDLKERELQNKIDTQGDIITQLRGQISNDKQTEAFNAAFNTLNDRLNAIAAKQPNTVPVQWPNIIAANATPYVGWGYGYGQTNFWN